MGHTIVTQPAETQGLRHDPTTIALHWIRRCWCSCCGRLGRLWISLPNGPLRIDYRSVHIVLGVFAWRWF